LGIYWDYLRKKYWSLNAKKLFINFILKKLR
jgi:hypothetical protein